MRIGTLRVQRRWCWWEGIEAGVTASAAVLLLGIGFLLGGVMFGDLFGSGRLMVMGDGITSSRATTTMTTRLVVTHETLGNGSLLVY